MLQYNTMRYGTDELSFKKSSLLTPKTPFNTAGQNHVDGFEISGAEPAGSQRKILFKVDGALYKFSDGNPVTVGGSADFDNVIANGNTPAELAEISGVPSWVDKNIYPIIALYSPSDALALPTIKLGLKVRSSTDVYEKTVETAEFELAGTGDATPRIINIEVTNKTTGHGAINVTARTKVNGEWGDFIAYQSLKETEADAIQFRIRYTVTTINGADSAKVEKIVVRHTQGAAVVSGDSAEIYSVMHDYNHGLQTCTVIVRHKRFIDSGIAAFVNFVKPTSQRIFLPIGTSTGSAQTLTLGVDGVPDVGIDPATIKLFANGLPIANFSYNTETGEATINTIANQEITATYNFGRQKEIWREMSVDVDHQPYDDGSFLTRFTYSLPDEELDGQSVTNIRLKLYRNSGSVENEFLGVATGGTQLFVLKHAAKSETLSVNASFSYDESSQILTCVAPEGTELTASYDWLGEGHTIYSWAAAWSPAL
ncbi:MAG: hypothetical protein IKO74_02430 [Selenomonadaceae bacterium]|nr:hypothetical protein [Selenomonadaceae bacterium]